MKVNKYKKVLLASMVLAAMPLLAATDTKIKVTTFADEDGENANACSLREAIRTAELRKAYGGCTIVDIDPAIRQVIQLEAGTYQVNKELSPSVNISIIGKEPVDWEKIDVLTNDYPAKIPLQTRIRANNTRIFNTAVGRKALNIRNVILENGRSTGQGGAIFAGADVSLTNGQILNSQANSGGAIFLAGPTISLTLDKVLIQGNQAAQGSVLAMSCFNDTIYSERNVNISSSAIINNGSGSSRSVMEFCGASRAGLNTNTITHNTASASNGSIIKFTGDTGAGSQAGNSSILSANSRLTLISNTIVNNNALSTLLYDKLGLKELSFNIMAYNQGYSCRYLLGNAKDEKDAGIGLFYNALALKDGAASKCDVPSEVIPSGHTNIDISNQSIAKYLSPLQAASAQTAFLPLYYPKINRSPDSVDLVDVNPTLVTGCTAADQRGLNRAVDGTLYYNSNSRNTCDIGSVELMKLTAGDIQDLSNTSLTRLLESYQESIDLFEGLIKNPETPKEFLVFYRAQLEKFKRLKANTEANLKYRAIYIDLEKFKLPLPEEIINADGSQTLQYFSPAKYRVTTEVVKQGPIIIDDQVYTINEELTKNLRCEWNSQLNQILFYRVDDLISTAGNKDFCKYTITSNDTGASSSGLLQASFSNIAPVAKEAKVTLDYLKNQKLAVNLLNFANDDGDGPVKTLLSKPNKPSFWVNSDGVQLPIRITNIPQKNLIVTADRMGSCPGQYEKDTCYGGNVYIQASNAFNPFNYDFDYEVFDADGQISNTAKVKVISTATTTDDTRGSGGGGGSLGVFSILAVAGLVAYRRFRRF